MLLRKSCHLLIIFFVVNGIEDEASQSEAGRWINNSMLSFIRKAEVENIEVNSELKLDSQD